MRMHQNIAEYPARVLNRNFNGSTKAIGTAAPTTHNQAMGMAGKNGVVSFIPSDGGNQVYTLFVWNSGLAAVNGGNGWAFNGANVNEYTKTCDAKGKISFTITEDEEFFIQAGTTAVTDCIVSGQDSPANPNTNYTAMSAQASQTR